MSTWISDIVRAMSTLGGEAHYSELYAEIERIRAAPLPNAWKKIVQRQIQDHAGESLGFKRKKLFYPVNGLGSGTWGLVPGQLSQIVPTLHEELPSTVANIDLPLGQQRNTAWSRDELILALQLYITHGKSPLRKDSAEILELSGCLNSMNSVLGQKVSNTFRNTNGVYMKLMNFRRFDPEYTASGKVGLTRGNKDEEVVWTEFSSNLARLNEVAAAIRLAIKNGYPEGWGFNHEPGLEEASEGKVLTRLHHYRERNRPIVAQRKKLALKLHGCLACEVCGFDFSAVYGDAGSGIIEVHHTKPLHTLAEGEKTRLQDLALLCANCHRVVHSSRKWLSIDELRLAYLQHTGTAVNV